MLEMGPIEQSIIKQHLKSGQPIPERIQNAPELIEGLNLYLIAFFELDSERQSSLGYAPIPWSAIKDWGLFYDLDDEQMATLYSCIRAMDKANSDYVKSQSDSK
jgi:hypothetical protein